MIGPSDSYFSSGLKTPTSIGSEIYRVVCFWQIRVGIVDSARVRDEPYFLDETYQQNLFKFMFHCRGVGSISTPKSLGSKPMFVWLIYYILHVWVV